jgi:hypothetical protein
VVVFEDLHWASDSLLDLVEHVMHHRTRAALLIIVTSRPELLDRRPAWGGGRRNFTALALDPLSENQSAELVVRLGENLPETVRRRIVERSGGNPFFATELVRAVAERGGRVSVVAGADAPADVVPDTVHATVLARLDLLSPPERTVLQAAAVGGTSFTAATLEALLEDVEAQNLDSALDSLLARDLIVPGEGEAFAFRHILIRDVAYGTLSRAERVRMHERVAEWLEHFAAKRLDEFTELIAYHYREATVIARQSAVPLPLSIDPGRAVRFLERAGEIATRSGAFTEARNHLQHALELAAEAEHTRLYEKLGDCAPASDFAIDAYWRAFELWRAEGARDPLIGARLLRKLLVVYMRFQGAVEARPEYDQMVTWRAEARKLAEDAGDEEELWHARVADLFWPFWKLEISPDEAAEGTVVGLAAADYFEARADWRSFSEALDGYCSTAFLTGDHRQVIAACERRLVAPELTPFERGDALHMMSDSYLNLGEYDRCIGIMREAVEHVRPGESAAPFGQGLSFAAFAAFVSGRWSEMPELLSALSGAVLQHEAMALHFMPGHLGALHIAMARADRAGADAAEAVLERVIKPMEWTQRSVRSLVAAYREDDPGRLELDLLPPEGRIYASRSYLLAAMFMFMTERGIAPPEPFIAAGAASAQSSRVDVLMRSVAIAQVLAAGDVTRLKEAIGAAERHGLIPHAARMGIVLAQLTGDSSFLAQVRPTLERLGDRQFLRRLEEVGPTL